MIYKILHEVFGWDYISWENTADNGIARVYKGFDGKGPWYFRYKITSVVDRVHDTHAKVVWLTCEPSKYDGEPTHD